MTNLLARFLIIFTLSCVSFQLSSQTDVIDWGSYSLSGYSQTISLPTGQTANVSYSSSFNVGYKTSTNSAEFSFGTTSGACDGISNSGPGSASGVYLADDYNSSYGSAINGKNWVIDFTTPVEDVNFNIYDLTSIMHSNSYPNSGWGVYNDQVVIQGKDHDGATIYPTLTTIGTTFGQGLDDLIGDCAYIGGTYEGVGYSGDVDGEAFIVNNSNPPTAYVLAGSINRTTGFDNDCFAGGFFYGMDVNVNFGTQNVSEITITYKNFNNGLLGASDPVGLTCVRTNTSMQGQGILIGDVEYSEVILPVKLKSFSGQINRSEVLLQWETASEINSEGYWVQHSVNGQNFMDIGFVKSKSSNSQDLQDYNFETSYFQNGTNYYRLRQIDFQGNSDYSDVITIRRESDIVPLEYDIYPNPANNSINILGSKEALDNEVSVDIYNQFGIKCVHTRFVKQQIDISAFPPGIYYVNIYRKGLEVLQKKLIKL